MQLQTRAPHMRGHSIRVNGTTYEVDKNLCIEVDDQDDIDKLLSVGWTDEVLLPGTPNGRKKAGPRAKVPSSLGSAKDFVALVARDEKLQEACAKCQTHSELHELAQGLGFGFTKPQLEQAREAFLKRLNPTPPGVTSPPDPKKLVTDEMDAKAARKAQKAAENAKPVIDPEARDTSSPHGEYSKKVLKEVAKTSGLDAQAVLERAFQVDQEGNQNGYYDRNELTAAANALLDEADADTGEGPAEGELTAHLPDGTPAAEWPDPDDSMKMDYLREMADAYEVEDVASIRKKADLIKAITAKMY